MFLQIKQTWNQMTNQSSIIEIISFTEYKILTYKNGLGCHMGYKPVWGYWLFGLKVNKITICHNYSICRCETVDKLVLDSNNHVQVIILFNLLL